jgi:cobalt-precorrin-5B (C1)-methyltransferase
VAAANTTALAFEVAPEIPLAQGIAARAHAVAAEVLAGAPIALEVLMFDRQGGLVASHGDPLKRRT